MCPVMRIPSPPFSLPVLKMPDSDVTAPNTGHSFSKLGGMSEMAEICQWALSIQCCEKMCAMPVYVNSWWCGLPESQLYCSVVERAGFVLCSVCMEL